jgi:DNA-binding response OmpR family regulator
MLPAKPYIIAVDDDPEVLGTLGRVLEYEGFEHQLIAVSTQAIPSIEQRRPDMVILDINMPELDGIAICRMLRNTPRFMSLPILFLTARGTTDDIVAGLDSGADDYIVKPFELTELRARIHALLRRGMRDRTQQTVLIVNDIQLDSDTYQAMVGKRMIQLTSTEHRLLRYLMENANQALSATHLLQMVWDYPNGSGDPDLVRAHVRNLRAKLEEEGKKRYIRTIHGVGYTLNG